MRLKYRIQGFVMASGERYGLLVDRTTGAPLFHPNLFVTTQVRNRSLSLATMEAALTAINIFLTFCAERSISLEERLLRREFLGVQELDAVRDFCQWAFSVRRKYQRPEGKQLRFRVGSPSLHARLTHIANYISWLASTSFTLRMDEATRHALEVMRKGLLARRPLRKARNALNAAAGTKCRGLVVIHTFW